MNKKIATEAFELRNYINGTESGGIDPIRIVTKVTEDADIVDIEYTYPAICGLSDVRYHCIDHGKTFHETYRIDNDKIYLMNDGKWDLTVFPTFTKMPELLQKIEDFYKTNNLRIPA